MIRDISMHTITFVWLLALALSQPELESPDSGRAKTASSKYVSDSDAIISSGTRDRIAERLRFLDEDGPKFPCGAGPNRGFQFAVALFERIGDGGDIEKFSSSLFNDMGLGYRECNNGVLFVLSRLDRKNHVKTGKGARPVLTDGHAAEILESLKPELRSGDYDAAVEKAVNRIVEEALSKGEAPWQYGSWAGSILHWMWENLVASCIIAGVGSALMSAVVSSHIATRRKIAFETKLQRLQMAKHLQSKQLPDSESLCPICIETFPTLPRFEKKQVEGGVELLKCGHVFHEKCIAKWLTRHNACPLCRESKPRIDDNAPLRKRQGKEEAHQNRDNHETRSQRQAPDDHFWRVAFDNLSSDYSDVPGVSRARSRLSHALPHDCDLYSCYTECADEVHAEEVARARIEAARSEANNSSSSSSGFDGGSCDGGGGAGGSW